MSEDRPSCYTPGLRLVLKSDPLSWHWRIQDIGTVVGQSDREGGFSDERVSLISIRWDRSPDKISTVHPHNIFGYEELMFRVGDGQAKVLSYLHSLSSNHKERVEASETCGCFDCLHTFPPSDIKEWIDKGQTALCPICGVDSVLPEPHVGDEVLKQMHHRWFVSKEDLVDKLRAEMTHFESAMARHRKKIDHLKEQIAPNCEHPDDFIHVFQWEHDDGYGKQTRKQGLRCSICKQTNRWPDLSQRWTKEDE